MCICKCLCVFTSYNSDSVMQKSKVPEVTCILADCSLVEVVVWKEVTRRKIEIGHKTESKCKKARKEENNRGRRIRKRNKEREIKIVILVTYLECLAVFSLVLQLEVAVQSHYGDTA